MGELGKQGSSIHVEIMLTSNRIQAHGDIEHGSKMKVSMADVFCGRL